MLIAGVMLLTIFEGAVRKWVFASNPTMRYGTYFAKDFLYFFVAYLGLRSRRLSDLSWLVACAALILVLSAVPTLLSSNPLGIFLSLRAYLLIPACAYLAAGLVRDFRDIEQCALVVAVASIGVAMLSTYQYSLPASHILNRYDSGTEETHIVATAGHVRATGTFAYISGMAMFAGFCAWAGTLLALPLPGRPPWKRVLGLAALVSGFVCAATAMSRGGTMFWGVTIVGGCLLYFRPQQSLKVLLVLVLISPLLSSGEEDFGEAEPGHADSLTSGLVHRFQHGDTFIDRGSYMLQNLYLGVLNHPLGEGLGAGQPGARFGTQPVTRSYESEWGRIAFEIGPIGLATVLFIRFATWLRCVQQLFRSSDQSTRLVLAVTVPYFGIMSLGWMAFNHTGNSFAWSVVGLALGAAYGYCRQPDFTIASMSPAKLPSVA